MSYKIVNSGESRSFPDAHPFLENAASSGSGVVFVGSEAGQSFLNSPSNSESPFVAIELGTECLAAHNGEQDGTETSNVVGFARFRLGNSAPSQLVELVKQPGTKQSAIDAARQAFTDAGLKVAVCNDFPGRIVDRLIRPYYNAALRRLDEKLATAADMDKTLCLGLGYPEGPISILERTGLEHHFAVTSALHEALGQEAYAPARRAQVAANRTKK